MLPYTQWNRSLRVRTPLGPDVLLLEGFSGEEACSHLFEFQLQLVADNINTVDFDKILGKSVTVELDMVGTMLPIPGTRYFNGIVREFTIGHRNDKFTEFRATVVPKLWLSTLTVNSRIFQQKTVQQILEEVLTGIDVEYNLTADYFPRDYCVQYRETDFNFVSRLMEEEGIFYYFEHAQDSHKLKITDTISGLPDISTPNTVMFEEVVGEVLDKVRVKTWTKSQRVCSAKTTLWDHSFQLPGKHLEVENEIQEKVTSGTVDHTLCATEQPHEVYNYPGYYAKRFDGIDPGGAAQDASLANVFKDNQRVVRVRMEQMAAEALHITGNSNTAQFCPGYKFTLLRHPHADGSYYLTRVFHQAEMTSPYRSGNESAAMEYNNRFECQPEGIPHRPQMVTPRPRIRGMQTATVTGPEGSEIFVDIYGRVKVQFHWDRLGQLNADSSCWLRVAQVWAGPNWGAFFWPRIGHEVVVIFEDGDPDQPIIIGSVYNAKNMPAVDLPGESKVGGIKSCIFGGDPLKNFNALVFHDGSGAEYTQVHSERHEVQNSEVNKMQYTPQGHFYFHGSL